MSSEIAIKVTNLSKCYQIYDNPKYRLLQMITRSHKIWYHEFWALNNLSFEVKKGDMVGVIGRNGSGKSTLLQLVCGTLRPTLGQIEKHGRVAALLELGSGFNPEFTGLENIFMNAAVLGLNTIETAKRLDSIIDFADIGDFIAKPVKTYSSGMVVRLAFAVIAHVDADILIVDEALSVGDAFFSQKCMRFLHEFMKKGTVFFVSHDTGSVKSLCNHAIWLDKGQIIAQGSPKEICEKYMEDLYALPNSNKTIKLPASTVENTRAVSMNVSKLTNELSSFRFNPDSAAFGEGGAKIEEVVLISEEEKPLNCILGGEKVVLRVISKVLIDLDSPIIGFYIKDRLGQWLFGDNTYLTYQKNPLFCQKNSRIQADFAFQMPWLPAGNYSITAAIASGSQFDHRQHHFIHDAVVFKSESSNVVSGLIGIPMQDVRLQAIG